MKNFASIKNGLVDNIIVIGPESGTLPDDLNLVDVDDDSAVSIGWSYENGGFIAPPEPLAVDADSVVNAK